MDDVFKLLAQARGELENPAPTTVPKMPWGPYNHTLSLELEKHWPFSLLAGKGLRHSNGVVPAIHSMAMWCSEMLLLGTDLFIIPSLAFAQIEAGGYDALEVTIVHGIQAYECVPIEPDTFICPKDALPDCAPVRVVFEHNRFIEKWYDGTAALAQQFRQEDVICDLTADVKLDPRGAEKRKQRREDIRRALLLNTSVPVEMPISFVIPTRPNILATASGFIFSKQALIQPHNETPEFRNVVETLALLDKFNGSRSLHLVVDRIGNSRPATAPVDRALDLGMALEMLLMHENGSNPTSNQEISNKLASRAAWLLCRDGSVDDRLEYFKLAKAMYDHRSKAAHTGQLKDKTFNPIGAEAFVVLILKKILTAGRFPDWSRIVLGEEF